MNFYVSFMEILMDRKCAKPSKMNIEHTNWLIWLRICMHSLQLELLFVPIWEAPHHVLYESRTENVFNA